MDLKFDNKNVAIAASVMIVIVYIAVCYAMYRTAQNESTQRMEVMKSWKPCLDTKKDIETIAHESGLLAEEKEMVKKQVWPPADVIVPTEWSEENAARDGDSSD